MNKKKFIFATIGIFLLFCGWSPPAFSQESITAPFSDVHIEDRHYVAIEYLREQGFIQGYEDGKFYPGRDIDRASALALLFKVIKPKPARNILKVPFADVQTTSWFYSLIEQSYSKGVIQGYPDKLFHPERIVNKAQSLKIALLLQNDSLPSEVTTRPYSDVELGTWLTPFAEISHERGLFTETRENGGELLGDTPLTRGQFAEFVYRLIKSNQEEKFGRATFYADFLAGHGTSAGDAYNPDHLTTAHPTLPFGTKILVKNLANGKEVQVIVNDRGPYAIGVHLDLSKSAFSSIASLGTGIIDIEYKVVQ